MNLWLLAEVAPAFLSGDLRYVGVESIQKRGDPDPICVYA